MVADGPQRTEWQWTKKEATLAFRNPKRDVVLFVEADNPATSANSAQQLDVLIGDQVAGLRAAPQGRPAEVRKIPITAAQLGGADMAEIRLVVDKTFVPALEAGGEDRRHPRARGARVPRLRAVGADMRLLRILGVAVVVPLGLAAPAAGEILVFHTGRTMSVAAVEADGDRLRLTLRDGGEASVPAALIARIDADEVAAPAAAPLSPAAAAIVGGGGTPQAVLAGRPFAALIASTAAAYGVDERLVHAVIETESNYQPRARSRAGAKGLMQLMPATARQYAVGDPYDPRANIEAGVRHLKDLLSRFELRLALAAYNAGEGAVRTYGGLPPFAETRPVCGSGPAAGRPIKSPGATIRGQSRSNRLGR